MISIIVLNHNGKDHLLDCLDSLISKTWREDIEIIVVDNGSRTDDVVKVVKSYHGVKYVRSPVNLGISGGYNLGAEKASGEYLVFLNNDTIAMRGWISQIMKVLATSFLKGWNNKNDLSIGAVQSKLLTMESDVDCSGGYLDIRGIPWEAKDYVKKEREIFYAKGAMMFIPRNVFNEVGGFDDSYVSYFEDTDLSWRIWLSGRKVIVIPDSIVFHAGGATMSKVRRPLTYYYYRRNQIITLLKNYSLKNAVKYFTIAVLMDTRNVAVILVSKIIRRRVIQAPPLSILKAYVWILKNLSSIARKRARVQERVRKVSDEFLMKKVMRDVYSTPKLIVYGLAGGRK